jgi:hypothetical protein
MTRFLYIATYVFLCLPYVFFLSGWLRLPYALVSLALLVWGSGAAIRSVSRDFAMSARDRLTTPHAARILVVLAPVIVVMSFNGVGGWGYQDSDWLRGNAVMLDLVDRPWPVVYQTESGPLALVYYFAFYLPAAWVGKAAGWHAANHTLFVYAVFGLSLAALWTVRLAGARRWWAAIVFLGFSGMDVVGKIIRTAAENMTGIDPQTWWSLEWWAGFGVVGFPSHEEMLTTAPMQAIPGWLITSLVLNDAREKRLLHTFLFYLGVSTLWAPFVAIGLLPLVIVLLRSELSRRGWLSLASWPNALGMLLGLVSTGYYSMRAWPYTLPFDVSHLYQEHFTLTLFRLGPLFLGIYPLFAVLEFGLLHALLYAHLRLRGQSALLDPALRQMLVASTIALLVLPWLNYGWNNDFVLRACVPMLFVTAVVVLRVLDERIPGADRRIHLLKYGLVLVIAVGALNAVWILGRQVLNTYEQGALVAVPDARRVRSLFELQQQRYNGIGFNFVAQYLGSPISPFAEHVMAHPAPTAP